MLEGRRIAFEMAKPGVLMSEVDQKVNNFSVNREWEIIYFTELDMEWA